MISMSNIFDRDIYTKLFYIKGKGVVDRAWIVLVEEVLEDIDIL